MILSSVGFCRAAKEVGTCCVSIDHVALCCGNINPLPFWISNLKETWTSFLKAIELRLKFRTVFVGVGTSVRFTELLSHFSTSLLFLDVLCKKRVRHIELFCTCSGSNTIWGCAFEFGVCENPRCFSWLNLIQYYHCVLSDEASVCVRAEWGFQCVLNHHVESDECVWWQVDKTKELMWSVVTAAFGSLNMCESYEKGC